MGRRPMILTALFAANCLLPPGPYQPPQHSPIVQFVDAATLHEIAGRHGSQEWRGVEWGFNKVEARTFAYLLTGTSTEESCSLRHALGHFSDYERTGNPNPRHIGWEYQE